MKKRCLLKRPRWNNYGNVVSEDQVNFKSETSDQAIAKAFLVVLNLRKSADHSYNVDFIVTVGQVKDALIKVYGNDKEQKNCPATYDDILIKQICSIIFPRKEVEVTNIK